MAKGHGGARPGAGRKPKAVEIELIERIDNLIDKDQAIERLRDLVFEGNFNAIKLYLEYRFGKPKETVHNINENFNTDLNAERIKKINEVLENAY